MSCVNITAMEIRSDILRLVGAFVGGVLVAIGLMQSNVEPAGGLIIGLLLGVGAAYLTGGFSKKEEGAAYIPQVPLNYAHPSVVDATIERSKWLELYA